MKNLFVVIWRQGGTANFKWIRTDAWTREVAEQKKLEIERMGYVTLLENAARSYAIGIPETFEAA